MNPDIKAQSSEPLWKRLLLPAAVAVFLASTVWNVGTRIQQTSSVYSDQQHICEAINGDRAILRGILIRSETISLKNPNPDFSEARIRAYYDHSLRDLAPTTC